MLRACALDYGSSWDENLPYAEFSYNTSHQASIEMAPFEALYGIKCTIPLLWNGVGERSIFGPDIIKDAEEKVRLIRDRLKIAQSRQKSCGDPGLPIWNTRYAYNSRSHDQCVVNPHIRVDNRITSSITIPNNILTIGHMTKSDIATQGKSTIEQRTQSSVDDPRHAYYPIGN
jgi:hypothetical protein